MDFDFKTVLTIAAINIGLVAWLRADMKESRSEAKSDLKSLQASMSGAVQAIQDEMKSFHGRLCTLEEKYLQLMQRIWEKRP